MFRWDLIKLAKWKVGNEVLHRGTLGSYQVDGRRGDQDLGHDGTDGNDKHDDEDLLGEDGDVSHE